MNTITDKGTVKEFTLQAPQLYADKSIWVYLPAAYAETDNGYPVIYMHDGQNVFDHTETQRREWHVEEKLNALHGEAIVVGIEHGGDKHRIDEMTPFANETHGGGHADDYLDFIIHTLKPYIDSHYRTLTNKQHTTIFGSSVGGLISFYALLRYPEVFGNAGVFSPSFWFSHEIYEYIKTVDTIDGRIYIMAGDRESNSMLHDIAEMEELILQRVANPAQLYKKVVHNGQHNEKLWRKEFAGAYTWLMEG
ncbi:alpha/beta hydrolase [Flavobacterium sp. RHBU_24]|uniref:alpha/beta hydrolase n=1 Tax=Flavobacterium sp. RHBU_24 TaxID=3391185 RepID=UPI0039856AD2